MGTGRKWLVPLFAIATKVESKVSVGGAKIEWTHKRAEAGWIADDECIFLVCVLNYVHRLCRATHYRTNLARVSLRR